MRYSRQVITSVLMLLTSSLSITQAEATTLANTFSHDSFAYVGFITLDATVQVKLATWFINSSEDSFLNGVTLGLSGPPNTQFVVSVTPVSVTPLNFYVPGPAIETVQANTGPDGANVYFSPSGGLAGSFTVPFSGTTLLKKETYYWLMVEALPSPSSEKGVNWYQAITPGYDNYPYWYNHFLTARQISYYGGPFGNWEYFYNMGLAYSIEGTNAPVPEPERYALLLAGLGLMGVVARRKVKQLDRAVKEGQEAPTDKSNIRKP